MEYVVSINEKGYVLIKLLNQIQKLNNLFLLNLDYKIIL